MFRRRSILSLKILFVLAIDVAIATSAQILSPYFSYGPYYTYSFLRNSTGLFVLTCLITPFSLYFFDQYEFSPRFSLWDLFKIGMAIATTAIVITCVGYLISDPFYAGRWHFLFNWLFILMGVAFTRVFYFLLVSSNIKTKNAIIIGYGDRGRAILELIKQPPALKLNVVGFVDNKPEKMGTVYMRVPVHIQDGRIKDLVEDLAPDVIILALRRERYAYLAKDLIYFAMQGVEIWDVPAAFERLAKRIPLQYVDETWLLFVSQNMAYGYLRFKRTLDIILAAIGLIVTLPLTLFTALAITLESRGPVILKQKRLAQGGRIIDLYKFRSMYNCEPKPGEKGSCQGDARITKVGRIIRRLHVDEIPQLVNVLKGEISLIGPRAELLSFIREYWGSSSDFITRLAEPEPTALPDVPLDDIRNRIIPYFEYRFTVPQGITGWSQIHAPMLTSSHEDMTLKLEYDLYYVKNMSFELDLIIVFQTIKTMLLGKGK